MTRRQMLRLPLAALGAPAIYAQGQNRGMASRGVKPQPRGKPSGLPFDAHFVNVAQAAGLRAPVIFGDVDHNDYNLENMGCGAAFLDYDNDGWLDVILLTGRRFQNTPSGAIIRLYHNNRDGTFTDVTAKSGLGRSVWAFGITVGDYDNDGFDDVFITCWGQNLLFHNNGDGTFTDVSQSSGIGKYLGKAWGVVATDLNNDGRMDLFVANDTTANFLFMNRGNGKFEEIAALAGVGYSDTGRPRSGMGVDSADLNNDGWMDLFVANIDHEKFSLYQNNRDETFDDQADATAIGPATRLISGWGLRFFDYDNDGNLDLILANGNPDDLIETMLKDVTYREPLLLFHNDGTTLRNVSAESGPIFAKNISARGLAVGDFDNDGAVDVLISVNDAAPMLLHNTAARENHWLGIKMVGKKSNRDPVGARVTYQAGDLKRSRTKVGGGSFLSSHDPRLVLGIGKRTKIDWLEVKWPAPGGKTERFTDLPIDKYMTIVEEEGIKVA
jgi:enediyne biosynthesis protein E4